MSLLTCRSRRGSFQLKSSSSRQRTPAWHQLGGDLVLSFSRLRAEHRRLRNTGIQSEDEARPPVLNRRRIWFPQVWKACQPHPPKNNCNINDNDNDNDIRQHLHQLHLSASSKSSRCAVNEPLAWVPACPRPSSLRSPRSCRLKLGPNPAIHPFQAATSETAHQ